MNRLMKTVAVLLITALTVTTLYGCSGKSEQEGSNHAPDFTVSMADGGTFTLSDSRGKVVILNFWATWCGPCCMEMPAFQRLYNEYGNRIQVLAIDYGESENEVNDFIKKNGYTFPFALDKNASVSRLYPTDGIPYTVIIDKNGDVFRTFTGASSADEQYIVYRAAIEEALNG